VRKAQLNDNKKEVYFRLTPVGKKLFAAHHEIHSKERQRMYEFLERYSESELEFIKRLRADNAVRTRLKKRKSKNSEAVITSSLFLF